MRISKVCVQAIVPWVRIPLPPFFNLYNKGHNGILFEMEFPEGSQVSELQTIMPPKTPGFMFGEIKNEVVVPAGSLYEVTKNPRVDKDGILHIYLKFLNKWE